MAVSVLSVGQCSSDDYRIGALLEKVAGAVLTSAYTVEEAKRELARGTFALVLVNRIIDGDGSFGVAFIAEARRTGSPLPFMLVSDYAEAQAEAVAVGAVPGFGKSQLRDPGVAETLRKALAADILGT